MTPPMNDKNDRELLELAAKAAGELHLIPYKEEWLCSDESWNPLAHNGEALELAVLLRLSLMWFDTHSLVMVQQVGSPINRTHPYGEDILSATRRAIVKTAASIASAEVGSNG